MNALLSSGQRRLPASFSLDDKFMPLAAIGMQQELQKRLRRRTQRVGGMPKNADLHMWHCIQDGARFDALAFQRPGTEYHV